MYFPEQFGKREQIQYNVELLKKMKLEVDGIFYGKINEKAIEEHQKTLLLMFDTNSWNINKRGNMEREMETGFEKFLFAISENVNESISDITVFRFYALIEYLKEKNKK